MVIGPKKVGHILAFLGGVDVSVALWDTKCPHCRCLCTVGVFGGKTEKNRQIKALSGQTVPVLETKKLGIVWLLRDRNKKNNQRENSDGYVSGKVFASQERVSGFPEKGLNLRGSPGNFRGSPGELPGKFGKLPGNPWIAVKFHSERTSGEVAEKLPGKFGGTSGGSPGTSQKLGVA